MTECENDCEKRYAIFTWFPGFLEKLAKVFPNVDLQLTIDASVNLQRGLVTRALDVAFLMGPINDNRIENIKFATYEQSWVAAPSTGLLADTPYNLIDLQRFPLITGSKLSNLYMEITGHLKKNLPFGQ